MSRSAGTWVLILRPALGVAGAYLLWRLLSGIIVVAALTGTTERIGFACAALLPGVLVLNLMIALQMLVRALSRTVDPLAGADNRSPGEPAGAHQHGGAACRICAGAGGVRCRRAAAADDGRAGAGRRVRGGAPGVLGPATRSGPLLRAPGMAATFAVNVATFGAAVWAWWP